MLKYLLALGFVVLSLSSRAYAICSFQYFQVNNSTSTTLEVYSHSTQYKLAPGDSADWPLNDDSGDQYKTGQTPGHFAQVAWQDARFIGCAWRQDSTNRYETTLQCNYYSGGKYNNDVMPPYVPTTGTPGDITTKQERSYIPQGLCTGCQSKDFGDCKVGIDVTNDDLLPIAK